jgi:hypothetical protein
MTTRDLTPRLSTLTVEATASGSTPLDHRSRITAPRFPLPLIARPGRGKGALLRALYARTFDRWPVVVAARQQEWTSLPTRPGGTPVRMPGGHGLLEVRGGRS